MPLLTMQDVHVNAVLSYDVTLKTDIGAAKAVSDSAFAAITDPSWKTSGTADSGSGTTLVDDALTQVDDFWNMCRIMVTLASGSTYLNRVQDFDAGTDTLTLLALPQGEVIAAADTYEFYEYPVTPWVAASVASNVVTVSIPTTATLAPGPRRLWLFVDYGTTQETHWGDFRVLP